MRPPLLTYAFNSSVCLSRLSSHESLPMTNVECIGSFVNEDAVFTEYPFLCKQFNVCCSGVVSYTKTVVSVSAGLFQSFPAINNSLSLYDTFLSLE